MNVVSNECGRKWMWSQMNVVSNECGPKWMLSQMNVVPNECGLKWMWSQMNVVSNECGLKWMWAQMNVVSNEKISYECGLKRTGLKWSSLKWMWFQMKWSQMNDLELNCLNCLHTVQNITISSTDNSCRSSKFAAIVHAISQQGSALMTLRWFRLAHNFLRLLVSTIATTLNQSANSTSSP